MKKLLLMLISFVPLSAFASFGIGASVHNWGDVDSGYGDLDFTLTTINATYETRNDNLGLQVKVGLGVGDDSDDDEDGDRYDVEINHMVQLKGMYFFNDNFYGALSYTNFDIDGYIEYNNTNTSDSENDIGFAFGYRTDGLEFYLGRPFDDGDSGTNIEFGFSYFFE